MAATNLFMNWSLVSIVWTPYGGSPTTTVLAEVLDVDPDVETKQEMFYGDALRFPKVIVNTERKRSLTITSGDIWRCFLIPENATSVITCVLNDAINGNVSAGGGIQLVLSNAVREKADFKAPNNKIGGGSITFNAFGGASDADPLVITQL